MADPVALPPGPRIPALLQLARYAPHPVEFLEACAKEFGDRFTIRLAGFGEYVLLARPQAVQEVFRADPRALHSGEANEFLSVTVGPRSVLVLDEAPHAEQRRVLVPPFHGERMRAHIGRMRDATLDSMAHWPVGRPFEIEERMREITLRSILEVVLGLDFEAEAATAAPLRDDFVKLLSYSRLPYAIVLAKVTPHRLLNRIPFWPYYRELRRINAALHDHLRRRRAALAAPAAPAAPASRSAHDDVLDELLRAKHADGAPLDDGEIRDALMTMLVAGHDTTSVALAWVFLMILERPAVAAKIREELARVAGGAPIVAEHLPRLDYLDAVIRESLRLCTIVVFVNRLTKQPFRADGHDYPAGIHLCPCIHLVHQDPTLYPEPKLFRPERFLERKFGPHEWFPFGGSDRLCIGMAFAMTQMKVVLATVFSRAQLERPSGAESHRVRRGVLVAPSDGTRVVMAARQSNSNFGSAAV